MTRHVAFRSAYLPRFALWFTLLSVVCEVSAREMTPMDVARLRNVTSVEISPDGSSLAYTLAVPRRPFVEEDGPAWQELHVIAADGSRSRGFVTGAVTVNDVKWRPGGDYLSFRAKRSGDKEMALYVIPVDGGEARRVVEHPTGVGAYAWSPDGDQVVYLARKKEAENLAKNRDKGFKAEVFEEDWQPARVWTVAPRFEHDSWQDLPKAEPSPLELTGSAHAVEWSPDGRFLAVSVAPTPSVDDGYMRKQIRIVDVSSGRVTASVETPGKLGAFRWSPDNARLALIGTTEVHDPQEGRLLVVERSGGSPRELLPGYAGHFTAVEWLNAESMLVLGDAGVRSELIRVNLTGERQTVIGPGTYVINSFTVEPSNGRIGLMIESGGHPAEVFGLSLANPAPERLTTSNPWLADMDFAPQEVVRHRARDGLELEGILIRPLSAQANRRYPLILHVHGGPEAHNVDGWLTSYSRPGQMAAARGFAVFYPNYRGSTGRGVEFSKLGQADYAGGEFNDLVDAVEHLVASGLVEKSKVGVTGGSYGGFATAWCSTALTEHFAAGVMAVGISHHISKFGTTEIPNEMYLVHGRKYPWDDWNWFLERSPIRHAAKGRTPLLILHGKDDTRVHPSQSQELYRHLKTHGNVPVRLVWYPGEGHGNRNAAARLDYLLRTLRWFEHYLQGPGGDPPPYELDYTPYKPKEDPEADRGESPDPA